MGRAVIRPPQTGQIADWWPMKASLISASWIGVYCADSDMGLTIGLGLDYSCRYTIFGKLSGTFCNRVHILDMMALRYREDRATQAAARLLHLRGGPMSYLKLMKLLYISDRKALVELGRPITYDRFVSMKHGPVLSRTLDVMKRKVSADYWSQYISPPDDFELHLLIDEPPRDKLSRAEEAILDNVFRKYGHYDKYDLRDLTHTFPEWHNPGDSSSEIDLHDLLTGQGLTEDEASAIESSLEDEAALDALLA